MAKYKFLKGACAYALVLGVLATNVVPSVIAHADFNLNSQEQTQTIGNFPFETVKTPGGIANFGRGGASITIMGNGYNQSLYGKKFNVYKLFNAENSKGMESINYTMNDAYAQALKNVVSKRLNKPVDTVTEYDIIDYIQSINMNKVEGAQTPQTLEGSYSKFRYFVEDLRSEIVRLGVKSDVVEVTATKVDNSIEIAGLEFGYYVVDEISSLAGSHSAGSLCMVNTANPTASVQIKSDYPTVEKKIHEDDNGTGWNDIADFEIGQTIPYKFTSNVPNMNGYDTYYYAWRDVMHEALTFHKDSVGIKITDKTNGKIYTLNKNEFNVVETPGNGDTFQVEIVDLKKIVDREFNHNMNNLNENKYGQEVVLTYDAHLNEKAAEHTGRPGFENDVKLVFSNDADSDGKGSRGETPWDTVVCFTYKINGLKVNDHKAELADAKFRLYSDKDCKNEVYVKKSDKGYIVMNRDLLGGNDHEGGSVPQNASEMVSDAKGVFTIFGLDQGTYWLKETGAPAGYRPILDPIEITVVPTFTQDRDNYNKGEGKTDKTLQKLEASAFVKTFWEGIFHDDNQTLGTDVNDGSLNITVVNKVGSKLPITGSSATMVLMGLGSVLMAGSLVANRRKSVKKAEQ